MIWLVWRAWDTLGSPPTAVADPLHVVGPELGPCSARPFFFFECLTRLRPSVTILPMITIRLQRVGRKNNPSFRVIVTDSHKGPKTGRYLEVLGSYDPRSDAISLREERIRHWLSKGAGVSGTVHNLFVTHHIIEGKKINVLPRKTPIRKAEEEKPAAAQQPAAKEKEEEEVEKKEPEEAVEAGVPENKETKEEKEEGSASETPVAPQAGEKKEEAVAEAAS